MSIIEAPVTEEPRVLTDDQQTLLNAERYMAEHGWCRGATRSACGRVCVVGAVKYGNYLTGMAMGTAVRYLEEVIQEIEGKYWPVVVWNDDRCRSRDEALAVFRRARDLAGSEAA